MERICLDSEQKLRIYALPLRQRILREMEKAGAPVTAKQIADRLGITPSSAQHHLRKLESIGLVEQDHIELINGIQARLMRLTEVIVSIGQQLADATAPARDAFMENQLMEAYHGFGLVVAYARENGVQETESGNDLCSDILHLTDAQALELHDMILAFARAHKQARSDTRPWQIVYMAYDMQLAEKGDT